MASGVSETAAEMGIATGMAVLGSVATAVIVARTSAPLTPDAIDPALQEALTLGLKISAGVATAVLTMLLAVCVRRSRVAAPDQVPA